MPKFEYWSHFHAGDLIVRDDRSVEGRRPWRRSLGSADKSSFLFVIKSEIMTVTVKQPSHSFPVSVVHSKHGTRLVASTERRLQCFFMSCCSSSGRLNNRPCLFSRSPDRVAFHCLSFSAARSHNRRCSNVASPTVDYVRTSGRRKANSRCQRTRQAIV